MLPLISIIAPMYNEEELVQKYCDETRKALESLSSRYHFEILLVNDGSTDDTWLKMLEVYKKYKTNISLVNLTRNFGLEGAVSAGLKMSKGDIVVVMDADLQDPPQLIPQMVMEYEKGADIVIANRAKRPYDNIFKRWSAALYYKVLDSLSGKIHLERGAANYRLLSRKAIKQLLHLPEVNSVFRITSSFLGMKTSVIEYERNQRDAGKTKYNIHSMIRYALDSITGISIEPIRKMSLVFPVVLISILGNGLGLIVSSSTWKLGFYLGLLISFFFLLLYFLLILLGEYIGQIMLEVKHRPTALVYEYLPFQEGE